MKLAKVLMAAAASLFAGNAIARPEVIRIGYISTLSGSIGSDGAELLNAFNLGLEHAGGKLGGVPVKLITGDDQGRPQTGIQLARQMIERDNVDLLSGLLISNVGEAVTSVVAPTGRIVLAVSGGSSLLAGKGCRENYFTASWNTDTMLEAIGAHLARNGVKRVAAVAANYQAGWDAIVGLKTGYGAKLASEVLVQPGQSDFGAELSQIRAADPQALVMFLPGGAGIAFQRQLQQSGLQSAVERYAPTFQADETTFNALGESVAGLTNAGPWNPQLSNPVNERFVREFRARYGRTPSIMSAMAYDAVMLLDAATAAVDGNIGNTDAFRKALREVKFKSVRGTVSLGNNHFPIQDFYLSRVTKDPGGALYNKLVERVFEAKADAHHDQCPLR